MQAKDAHRLIDAANDVLVPLGFKRRAKSQEWSKHSASDRIWVHLNFGKAMINPSFGVEYSDLRKRWPSLPGATYSTMRMLGSLFQPHSLYSVDNNPKDFVIDMTKHGLPALLNLQERERVIESLRSREPAEWCVPSFSHRIRLAPLLLAGLGRVQEALDLVEHFAIESAGKDQLIPSYHVFRDSLRASLAG